MAQMDNFGFFDYRTGDGDKYKYTAEEFTTILSYIIGDGVPMKSGKKFDITAQSNTSLTLAPGAVFISGHCGWNVNSATIAISGSTSARKDYVIAKLDTVARTISIEQKVGAADFPTLTANEIPLYQIIWNAGNATYEDCRPFLYIGANMPTAQIVYSPTVPANATEGMVWLRPA